MKISIVTLSFNQDKFLPQAINSVLGQHFCDLEYIVVDPGSTDNSRSIIRGYGLAINHLIFEPDSGAAEGLNKGFGLASGEIFGFLNADDVLLPGSLDRVSAFFEANPTCGLLLGDGFVIDSRGIKTKNIRASSFTVLSYCYGGASWLQQASFFRRSAFEAVGGFNTENRTSWDGELFLLMLLCDVQVGYSHEDLACFRLHAKSITGSQQNKAAYRADCLRLFRLARGRNWGWSDNIIEVAFRLRRLITHPIEFVASAYTRYFRKMGRSVKVCE